MSDIKFNYSALQEVSRIMEEMIGEVKHSFLMNAVKAGARVLQKNAKSSLVSKMGASATTPVYSTTMKKTYKPLIEGIRTSSDEFALRAKVHIMGHGYLKWFEAGTQIRQTSKGANRGSIKALNFFFNAQQSSTAAINDAMRQSLEKQISKYFK